MKGAGSELTGNQDDFKRAAVDSQGSEEASRLEADEARIFRERGRFVEYRGSFASIFSTIFDSNGGSDGMRNSQR
jgi:hypothetical protein